MLSRRRWLGGTGAALLAAATQASSPDLVDSRPVNSDVDRSADMQGNSASNGTVALKDFQPRSMLHAPETKVPQARFPVIDVHTHLSRSQSSKNGVALGEKMRYLAEPGELLEVMERKRPRPRKVAGGSTASACRKASSARSTTTTPPGC